MARQLRIEFKGALYHILSRGNAQQNIFLSDDDHKTFLNILEEISDRFDIDIFAYVLMSNHYHLLLRTNTPNLSKSMQWLGTAYTRRFNLSHSRSGHLFQGRFKSILVQNNAYLTQLSCYIHRNPLRAGMVNRLADYRLSSYRAYAYKAKHPDWLKKKIILGQFKGEAPHKAYREKVQKYSDEETKIWENLRHGLIFGTKRYLDKIKAGYLKKESDPELPQLNRIMKVKNLEKSLKSAAKILDCDIETFKRSARISKKDVQNRDILLYYLRDTGRYTNKQIGELFGLSFSAVSRRATVIRSEIFKEAKIRQKYNLIKSMIKV